MNNSTKRNCKVCGEKLYFGSCGNLIAFCTWCNYSYGCVGEYIPKNYNFWKLLEDYYKYNMKGLN